MPTDYLVEYSCTNPECGEVYYFPADSLPGGAEHCEYCEICFSEMLLGSETTTPCETDDKGTLAYLRPLLTGPVIPGTVRKWLFCDDDETPPPPEDVTPGDSMPGTDGKGQAV